jgi:hypothetical protein
MPLTLTDPLLGSHRAGDRVGPALLAGVLILLGLLLPVSAVQARLSTVEIGNRTEIANAGRRCTVGLEEKLRDGLLRFEATCPLTPAQVEVHLVSLLFELYPQGRIPAPINALFLGRMADFPFLAERLVRATSRSGDWDLDRGLPRRGSPDEFVARLLDQVDLLPEVQRALGYFGLTGRTGAIDKVIIYSASQLAIAEELDRIGVSPDARLPADALVWLRLEPLPGPPAREVALEDLQWEHRVLLLFPRPRQIGQLLYVLNRQRAELEDRDVAWFVISSATLSNRAYRFDPSYERALIGRYTDGTDRLQTVLIGKDGGDKLRQAGDLVLQEIYASIDAMPMRRQEVRERSP